jgi:lipopolysaccharide transport system ATP-binding protein
MNDIVISVENLWKQYRYGVLSHRALYKDLQSWWARFRGKEDPNMPIGQASISRYSSPASDADHFWALQDISFEVKQGEVLGIIGKNGAGKSTLLKIMSSVTTPTKGQVKIRGRIASLLEVGTGFHPELTGRENVFLNGAILGMAKGEIKAKFEEMVAFAEVEKFIDTPVKRYSSGMYVRLAFAVAAHLEPEILLVDEVLAVGDAAFQKKCLGKMSDVAKQGRTVLFVSHNMGSVGRLCQAGILLDRGEIAYSGSILDAISRYTENVFTSSAEILFETDMKKKMQLRKIVLCGRDRKPSTELNREEPFSVLIEYEVREDIEGAHVGIMLDKVDGTPVCHSADSDAPQHDLHRRSPGTYVSSALFPGGLLNSGTYQIRVGIGKYGGVVYDHQEAFVFNLHDFGSFAAAGQGGRQRPGILAIPLEWESNKIG